MTSSFRRQRRVGLYRLFDAFGRLLYVGIGFLPKTRWGCHSRDKDWWSMVDPARTTIEWLASRAEALTAERKAIREELPAFNIVLNPRRSVRRAAASRPRKPYVGKTFKLPTRTDDPFSLAAHTYLSASNDHVVALRAYHAAVSKRRALTAVTAAKRDALAEAVVEAFRSGRWTQAGIVEKTGYSRERVRQILREAGVDPEESAERARESRRRKPTGQA